MPVPTEMQLVGCKRKFDEMEGVRVGETTPYCVQRQSILNISMCKLRTPPSKKEPSLRRSVLIFNTLRFIEQELKQEGFKFMPPPPPIVFPPAEQDMTLDPPPSPMMESVMPSPHCPIPMLEAGDENDVTRDADEESIDEDDDEEEDDLDFCDDSPFMAVTCCSSSPVSCSPLSASVTAITNDPAAVACNGGSLLTCPPSPSVTPLTNEHSQSMNCSATTCSNTAGSGVTSSSISIHNNSTCSSSSSCPTSSNMLLPSISTLSVTCSLPPVNTFMEPSGHHQPQQLTNTTTSGASGTTGAGSACSTSSNSSNNLTSISDVLLNAVPVLNSTPVATPSKDGPLSPPSSSMSQLFDLDTSKVNSSSSTSLPVAVTSQTHHHHHSNSSNPVLPHTNPGNNQPDCSLLQTLPLVTSITSHLHHTCISNNTSNHPLQQQQQHHQQQHNYSTSPSNHCGGSLNFFAGSFTATAAAALSTSTGSLVGMPPYGSLGNTTTVNITNNPNNRSSSNNNSNSSAVSANNTSFSDVDMSLYDFDLLASSAPNVKVAPLSAEELMHSFPSESYSGCIGPSPCYKSDFLGDDLDHIMQILVGI